MFLWRYYAFAVVGTSRYLLRQKRSISTGMDSSNSCRWRGERLHHHGDGVCEVVGAFYVVLQFVLCRRVSRNNPKVGLEALLCSPLRLAPHLTHSYSAGFSQHTQDKKVCFDANNCPFSSAIALNQYAT